LNILVVDDNKFIREVVSAMIIDSGHVAVNANRHEQANKKLEILSSIDPLTYILNRRGLVQVADTFNETLNRSTDSLARYGGRSSWFFFLLHLLMVQDLKQKS
jgi:CheY-like chemotaxis protein